MKIIKGRVLSFLSNPFLSNVDDSASIIDNGGILIDSDKIKEVDEFHILKTKYPQIEIYDYETQ